MISTISLIAALTPQHIIGIDNHLPWHLPNDLKRFKQLTLHKSIVMGRKTYVSLGKLLPHRRHIIITHNREFKAEGCEIFYDLPTALLALKSESEIWIIGGSEIFTQMINYADFLYLTLVEADVKGDCYFPTWQTNEWEIIEKINYSADEKHAYAYCFLTLKRIKLAINT